MAGAVRGWGGEGKDTAGRLFLVLRAHRVSSCFQAVWLAGFARFALRAPLCANVTRTRPWWEGEEPLWKDVWRKDLNVGATWESRSGRLFWRNSPKQRENDKIRKSVREGGGEVMAPGSDSEAMPARIEGGTGAR